MKTFFFLWVVFAPLAVVAADVAEAPSLELLEFLGSWETADGQWQDPLDMVEELDNADTSEPRAKHEDVNDDKVRSNER